MLPFRARYAGGRCGICDAPINEDELVVYVDDELCHAECAAEQGEDVDAPD